jgi:hypothetical protein
MFSRAMARHGLITVLYFLVMSLSSVRALADTNLVMVEQEGCHYCERWLAEIGDRYHLTEEGRIAPLRRVYLEEELPDDLPPEMASISITPTFALVREGVEVARLYGYAGDEFFWGQLQEMLNKLPAHLAVAEQ